MNFSDEVSPLIATSQVSAKMQSWSEAIAKGEAVSGDIYGRPSETQLRELENVRSLSRELQDNLHELENSVRIADVENSAMNPTAPILDYSEDHEFVSANQLDNYYAEEDRVDAKEEEKRRLTKGTAPKTEIQQFFKGQSVFLTGGSGFLGKVTIEKLLRSCADLENIYVLIRSKKGKDARTRLTEILDDFLFQQVREENPKATFKVVAIVGDMELPGLGISDEDRKMLASKVTIIINAAATVKFDEKLSIATNINVRGTKEVIALAKECKNLRSLTHISTAFSNSHLKCIEERFYEPPMTVEVLEAISTIDDNLLEEITPKLLGKYPNTYCFTKAIAEEAVRKFGEGMPICIVRPSIDMALFYYYGLAAAAEEKHRRKLQRRAIRDFSNPFELPDVEFRHIYRVRKEIALYLCDELGEDLRPHHPDGLPVHLKVLTSLHLLADGGYQRGTGQDHGLSIGQTTVSKFLGQFIDSVHRRLMARWIVFPGNERSRRSTADAFARVYGVPHILGAVDCTHVRIFPPPLPHGVQYLNRKSVHSLNVQLIADVNCKIISVNARFPGRVHDSFIFNNSAVKAELRRLHDGHIGEYFLLGDSGYALEPWLMTPVLHAAPDSPEARYTAWHCRARNTIERTNGYLKNVFRCLGHDRVLHYSPEKASALIYTCCVLYNIMLHYRMLPPLDELEVDDENAYVPLPHPQNGRLLRVAQEKRARIINSYFE